MKLQYLAVIFVVIIIPISLVLSEYIQTQIDTIVLQSAYKKNLDDATYAALKAFQINSINNKYSSISDSKIRDVQASINTFYNSLGTAMDSYVSSKEELSGFIPAVLFNLYDGYYIYSSYDNVYSEDADKKLVVTSGNYQNGLKPYIYYSAEYTLGTKTIVINYTLDNRITIYGDIGEGYNTYSGYLINPEDVTDIDLDNKNLKYKEVEIVPETLTEHLTTVNDDGTPLEGDYSYIIYNNQKVYQDRDSEGNIVYTTIKISKTNSAGETTVYDIDVPQLFRYSESKKTYLQSDLRKVYEEYFEIKFEADGTIDETTKKLNPEFSDKIRDFKSTSAFNFYKEAHDFSKNVVMKYLDGISQENNMIDNDLSVNTEDKGIFSFNNSDNDPMKEDSIFNTHRVAVIRKSIETNLSAAIANYTKRDNLSTTEFQLPVIDEENWYNIANNVSIIPFMQGIPMGMKYFNNYSVISNTKNEEVINGQNIYIIAESSGNREYHQPGCQELIDGSLPIDNAYTLLSFQRQTVDISEYSKQYFYPQSRAGKAVTGCYSCIVNATPKYDIDDIIDGTDSKFANVRKVYLRALARERYDLYNTNYDL